MKDKGPHRVYSYVNPRDWEKILEMLPAGRYDVAGDVVQELRKNGRITRAIYDAKYSRLIVAENSEFGRITRKYYEEHFGSEN